MDAGTHAVLVLADGRVLEEKSGVPAGEVARHVLELRMRHGAGARYLVDGADYDPQAVARIAAEVIPQAAAPRPPRANVSEVSESTVLATAELAHQMLWDTYDRATKVQAWLLNQASAFTLELLENNKRLADQANELQKRYQASIAEIDYLARTKMMMDAEASTERYARFLIDKAKAEAAQAQPARGREDWFDNMIEGMAFAVGLMCGDRPREPWEPN